MTRPSRLSTLARDKRSHSRSAAPLRICSIPACARLPEDPPFFATRRRASTRSSSARVSIDAAGTIERRAASPSASAPALSIHANNAPRCASSAGDCPVTIRRRSNSLVTAITCCPSCCVPPSAPGIAPPFVATKLSLADCSCTDAPEAQVGAGPLRAEPRFWAVGWQPSMP